MQDTGVFLFLQLSTNQNRTGYPTKPLYTWPEARLAKSAARYKGNADQSAQPRTRMTNLTQHSVLYTVWLYFAAYATLFCGTDDTGRHSVSSPVSSSTACAARIRSSMRTQRSAAPSIDSHQEQRQLRQDTLQHSFCSAIHNQPR